MDFRTAGSESHTFNLFKVNINFSCWSVAHSKRELQCIQAESCDEYAIKRALIEGFSRHVHARFIDDR
jgi:hypothetical protein